MCRGGAFLHPYHLLLGVYLRHFSPTLDFVADRHPREVEGLLDVSQAHSQHVDTVADKPRVVGKCLRKATISKCCAK